jgi:cilia- and flagella-associated protein 57
LEVEHEDEIDTIKMKHKDNKTLLEAQWKELEVQQDAAEKRKSKVTALKDSNIAECEAAKKDKKRVKEMLKQKIKQISLLEQERQDNMEKLTKREKDLYKYKFKIKDLQKSKHVLTHRTTEMKASL